MSVKHGTGKLYHMNGRITVSGRKHRAQIILSTRGSLRAGAVAQGMDSLPRVSPVTANEPNLEVHTYNAIT